MDDTAGLEAWPIICAKSMLPLGPGPDTLGRFQGIPVCRQILYAAQCGAGASRRTPRRRIGPAQFRQWPHTHTQNVCLNIRIMGQAHGSIFLSKGGLILLFLFLFLFHFILFFSF
jgi:hypothetical protein